LKEVPNEDTSKYGIVELDDNNKVLTFQEKEFLKRTGAERFQEFLRLMYQMKDFPSQYEKDKKGNFTIVIHTNKDGRLEP
ncbi:MAG: hypothetical protein ACPGU0_08590, partial [Marinirhabdus sp.]